MSMLDSFFSKGFKAAKCKTLLKLTIPRIKLLRNRREIQLKQMHRDIAKLLETGQEATARVRVEHIVREENMMAAQEILELFCELISVRLPIIEAQRECPLDLKEAISSICFAAPRCSDLPELLQAQMLFASKYGKEFVASATELMPDCCVNRQLVELLSVRAPSPGKKLKLLKEIAKEHELDWDPSATETEFAKQHEDLLNASTSTQASMITMLPLPEEKHDEILNSNSNHCHNQQPESDSGLDPLDFPEVPKASSLSSQDVASASEVAPSIPAIHCGPSYLTAISDDSQDPDSELENVLQEKQSAMRDATPTVTPAAEEKSQKAQYVPFISPPSDSSDRFSPRPMNLPSATTSRTMSVSEIDLQDVLAAAEAAAETAECAAAAARSAANLAQTRISELSKKNSDNSTNYSNENPFHNEVPDHHPVTAEQSKFNPQNFNSLDHHKGSKPQFDHQESFGSLNGFPKFQDSHQFDEDNLASKSPDLSFHKFEVNNSSPDELVHGSTYHLPQRLASRDDDSYFVYPNLFSSQKSDVGSGAQP